MTADWSYAADSLPSTCSSHAVSLPPRPAPICAHPQTEAQQGGSAADTARRYAADLEEALVWSKASGHVAGPTVYIQLLR